MNVHANLPNREKNGNVLRTNRKYVNDGDRLCLHERMSEKDGMREKEKADATAES